MKRALKYVLIFLIVAIIGSGSFIYFYLNSFSTKNRKDSSSYIEPQEVKGGEPFNVLLLGLDIGTVGSSNSPKRSDTMMILHYDPATSEISIVSVPRDTRVKINGSYQKINAANAIGGPSLAISTVEDLLNIKINYYATIDYKAFRKIIDAIGGIDVVVPYNMNYDAESQDLHIHFKKGESVHLNGQKAEEFVRWRKNNDGSGFADGDLGRIKAQQEFIVKIIEKVKSPSGLLKLPNVIKMLPDYINTNMDALTILSLSKDIPKLDLNSMQRYTIQGEGRTIDGLSYFVYSPEKSVDIIASLGGNAVSGETGENKVNNKDIKVEIMNGSGINGAASRMKSELEDKGYNVIGIGNISGVKFTKSHLVDKTLKGGYAKQVASELDISSIEKDQDNLSEADVIIILGLDREGING